MRDLTEWLRLNMRICLSATMMIEAAIGLFPQLQEEHSSSILGTMGPGMELHSSALIALYFTLSIWLVLGIRTSLVAAMSATLMIFPAILTTPDGDPALAIKIGLVAVYAMPLILFGGGRYAVLETTEPWMMDEAEDRDILQRTVFRKWTVIRSR